VIKVDEIWVNQSQAGIMRCGEPPGWHRQDLIVYEDEKKRRAVEVFEEAADCWDRGLRSWVFWKIGLSPATIDARHRVPNGKKLSASTSLTKLNVAS